MPIKVDPLALHRWIYPVRRGWTYPFKQAAIGRLTTEQEALRDAAAWAFRSPAHSLGPMEDRPEYGVLWPLDSLYRGQYATGIRCMLQVPRVRSRWTSVPYEARIQWLRGMIYGVRRSVECERVREQLRAYQLEQRAIMEGELMAIHI